MHLAGWKSTRAPARSDWVFARMGEYALLGRTKKSGASGLRAVVAQAVVAAGGVNPKKFGGESLSEPHPFRL